MSHEEPQDNRWVNQRQGFFETKRLRCVLSMPVCAEINSSMQQLINVKYSTSEQYKEATHERVTRDAKDTQEVLLYPSQRSPFTSKISLRNIATGVTAPPHVNVHKSKSIGKHILASMEGNPVALYIFRKKDQAVTIDTKSTINHAKNVRHNVFFRPENRRVSQKGNRCWNIHAMRALLGSHVTNNIMFLHAIVGCDTTSVVYGLGKKL